MNTAQIVREKPTAAGRSAAAQSESSEKPTGGQREELSGAAILLRSLEAEGVKVIRGTTGRRGLC